MGMFDYVKLNKIKCPICMRKLMDGQTKDTDCMLDYVDLYNPRVKSIVSLCLYCESYIKIKKVKVKEDKWISVSATKSEKIEWEE